MTEYRKFSLCLFVVLLFIILFCVCTNPVQTAGGASGTEVSSLKGIIYDTDGNPAEGVDILLRPSDYLADSALSEEYIKTHTIADTKTTSDGSFEIDSILPETYCIEALSGDSYSVLIRIGVQKDAKHFELDPERLLPVSMVKGTVNVRREDSAAGYVQVYGLERSVRADSIGQFSISVPPGVHVFHLGTVSLKHGKPLNQSGNMDITLDIGSGEMRNIGAVNLEPYPIHPCYDGTCDTMTIKRILDSLGYGEIPVDSVCNFRNGRISGISFRGMELKYLPIEIVKLKEVRTLDLGNTMLTGIIPEIGMMRLFELYLDSNNINSLPQEIGFLRDCWNLDLSANELESLPEKIVLLAPTESLDLSGNKLCNIDSSLAMWADRFDPDWQSSQRCP
ncbi:MAG TPA: hypothetical protein PLE24_09940 [Chitinispirillaceae bacterium]|jgi:hypothetical protein|nr:hypothetical protein [Chitinispirillaceae bacterium]